MEEFHIFYVEEELLEECLHMASQDATLSAVYDLSRATKQQDDPRKKAEAHRRSTVEDHHDRVKEGT